MSDESELVLGWWLLGCVSASDVVRWADQTIETAPSGEQLPEWLIALSLLGPREFTLRAHDGDPRPRDFTFVEAFRAMVEATDPAHEAAIHRFVWWVARSAMGEDLSLPEVSVGYELDDLLEYDPAEATARAKAILADYRPSCGSIQEALPWRRTAEQPHAADGRGAGHEGRPARS